MSQKIPSKKSTDEQDGTQELLRRYHELMPLYGKLADEIEFSLEKRIQANKIPFAHISKRVKTLESLEGKLSRKHYDNPWSEVADIAGVRVVFLYPSTRGRIESVIEREFEVIEKVDKLANLKDDQFGYGALHYVVRLGEKTSGARYEDLKHLVCEIQVRTVMQDAWAIIDHHLAYKNEASVPSQFKRRLNTISGMFENIDEQFDRMRAERETYMKEVTKQAREGGTLLEQEINFETMFTYLKASFPSLQPGSSDDHLSKVIQKISLYGVKTIADVERALKRTRKARESISKVSPAKYSIAEVARAVALIWPESRKTGWMKQRLNQFKENEHLIEKDQ